MSSPHVADLAAAYALGALPDDERAAVDARLRRCASCARAIASAEREVDVVVSAERRREPPPELGERVTRALDARPARPLQPVALALAAALLLGLLPSAYFWLEMRAVHGAMATQEAALNRLAATPHRSVAFRATPGAPEATVSYAPDGSWYVIVVRDAAKPLGVAWMHDGAHTMLGDAIPRGSMAMLYLPKSHRMDRLALMDGSRIIARADLAWGRTIQGRPSARSG